MTGEEIKALRERLGLNRTEFAAALGFAKHGRRMVQRLEVEEIAATGTAIAAMKYLEAIVTFDRSLETWDQFGTPSGLTALLDALPPFMRNK